MYGFIIISRSTIHVVIIEVSYLLLVDILRIVQCIVIPPGKPLSQKVVRNETIAFRSSIDIPYNGKCRQLSPR